jgi:hypothetical protein
MFLVFMLSILGFKKAAFRRAINIQAASQYNRLRPGWTEQRHQRITTFVERSPYTVWPRCGHVVPANSIVHLHRVRSVARS